YGIEISDTSIYDIIIDTGDKTPTEILGIILRYLKE
ncbi:MAG: cytidylate kinase, partial [Thermoplasmata archaeon M11B2D]